MAGPRGAGIIPALFLALWAGLIALGGVPAQAHERLVTIGSSSSSGSYSPAAGVIAKLVNGQRRGPALRCVVEYTRTPKDSLKAVLAHEMDFAVVPSDQQFMAHKGLGPWKEAGPQKDLRSVFTVNAETFFLVASEGSNIKSYTDLKGKMVGVGGADSGLARTFSDILAAYGMDIKDLAQAEEYKTTQSAKMLEDGRMDAFIYLGGNPSELVKQAVSGRVRVNLIPVDEKALATLDAKHRYYVKALIPLSYYPQALNTEDPPTIAVKASLVASAHTPEEVVYTLTRAVFDKLARFRDLNPAFADLTREDMLKGMTAPIHPGALKYFREAGLMRTKPAPKPKPKAKPASKSKKRKK